MPCQVYWLNLLEPRGKVLKEPVREGISYGLRISHSNELQGFN